MIPSSTRPPPAPLRAAAAPNHAPPSRSQPRRSAAPLTIDPLFVPPPHNEDIERSLISAVMLDEDGGSLARARHCGVKAAAFFNPSHRQIWQLIEDQHARGSSFTLPSLAAELASTGDLEGVGGYELLKKISDTAATSLELTHHAEHIVLLWQLRHTLTLSAGLAKSVSDFESRETFAATVGGIGQKLIRFGRREAVRTLEDQIESVKEDITNRAQGKIDKSKWVYTGLPTFDERLHPLNSARLDGCTVVAGASGHGKSAIFRQLTYQKLRDSGSVLVYTRETDIESFIEQMVSTVCEVDLLHLEDYAKLYPARIERFRAECDRLAADIANKRLWVIQHEPATPLETIEDLAEHYRAHAHLYGHPDMVVVDYLQLFSTRRRCNSREETVATVSHVLQALQRESGNLWLIGCQYNETGIREMRIVRRDSDGRVIHRLPNAGDLRESQAIFHDSDRCICLYRPPIDCRDQDNLGPNTKQPEIWLCQIKRRKGGTGIVKCWFEARYTRFAELSRAESNESEQAAAAPGQVPSGGMDKTKWKDRASKK